MFARPASRRALVAGLLGLAALIAPAAAPSRAADETTPPSSRFT